MARKITKSYFNVIKICSGFDRRKTASRDNKLENAYLFFITNTLKIYQLLQIYSTNRSLKN